MIMTSFDNRTCLDKIGLGLGQRVADHAMRKGELHLVCRVGDVKIGYCYIRKNACSSFKRLFLDMGEKAYRKEEWPRKIDYMIANQMMRSANAPDCDRIIFVYRDPVERIISLFKNKFIQRKGHEDIFRNYRDLTGVAPEQATFRHFVLDYLRPNFRSLDLHLLPQSWHLKRHFYTDAIPMGNLHARMIEIVGREIADRYFSKPTNTTQQSRAVDMTNCIETPANKLAAVYESSVAMPANNSFLDPEIRTRLEALYADDFHMISAIETAG